MKKLGYTLLIGLSLTLVSCYDEANEVMQLDQSTAPHYNGEDDPDPIPPPSTGG